MCILSRLADLLHEVSERPGISIERTGRVSLVRAVEEHLVEYWHLMQGIGYIVRGQSHHKSTRAYSVAYHDPLLLGGVESRGVVRARVQNLRS